MRYVHQQILTANAAAAVCWFSDIFASCLMINSLPSVILNKRMMFYNGTDLWSTVQHFSAGEVFQCCNLPSEAVGVNLSCFFCYQITFDAQFWPGGRSL